MAEMPHPATPFYRERTFLLALGALGAAAGFVGYRSARSRWRRRGVAGFATEAVLVVDLVRSTHLATHYGDGLAMQARTVLKDRTLAAAAGQGLVFAESTGDGLLMTFASVAGALGTAVALLADLKRRPPDLAPGPPLEVRAGVSYGEILLDARGGRHGAVINKAFRLESLAPDGFAQLEEGVAPETIPQRNRIFLDEDAVLEARDAGVVLRPLGFCRLKGFTGLHRVWEVVW